MKEKSTFEGKSVKGIANYYLTHTEKESGITLIALVITIIILLILAGVTIKFLQDMNIIKYALNASEGYKDEEQKELAKLNQAEELLSNYTITGTRDSVTIDKAEYDNLKESVSSLQSAVDSLQADSHKSSILLEKTTTTLSTKLTPKTWTTVDYVSLSGHGSGTALISFNCDSGYEETNLLHTQVNSSTNPSFLLTDGDWNYQPHTWVRTSASGAVHYDENTVIYFNVYSDYAIHPRYSYSIVLIEN